jgi:ComF family protein
MKYSDQSELAAMLAPLVMRAATPLFAAADLIVPVPMHRWRLARRRFNQSAELARALSRLSGVPMQVHILERHRATAQQVGLTRAARRSNLRGAFRVRADAKAQIAGRHVLLVDDVLTTGATVEACTRTLLRAGAGEVDVVTLARVVMPETLPV